LGTNEHTVFDQLILALERPLTGSSPYEGGDSLAALDSGGVDSYNLDDPPLHPLVEP